MIARVGKLHAAGLISILWSFFLFNHHILTLLMEDRQESGLHRRQGPLALLNRCFSNYSVLCVWIHSGPLMLVTVTKPTHASPPPPFPLFTWPHDPVLCQSLARGTPCSGCQGNDLGEGPPRAHSRTDTHTLMHCGKGKPIDILLYGGRGPRERGGTLQWAHCRGTGEISERVGVWARAPQNSGRGPVCVFQTICLERGETIHLSLVGKYKAKQTCIYLIPAECVRARWPPLSPWIPIVAPCEDMSHLA